MCTSVLTCTKSDSKSRTKSGTKSRTKSGHKSSTKIEKMCVPYRAPYRTVNMTVRGLKVHVYMLVNARENLILDHESLN